jgi:hypothetical protein
VRINIVASFVIVLVSTRTSVVACRHVDDKCYVIKTMTSDAARALALVQDVLGDENAAMDQVLAAIEVLRNLREQLATWEPELITAARAAGASWVALAPALGVASRQAAERRYLRLRPSDTGEATGEARVRAERDRRAGDRAVAGWARENSATLRELAGQVSAATGPGTVRDALADDDPATLLTPLADARKELEADHTGLAARIGSITEHTDRLRRDAGRG